MDVVIPADSNIRQREHKMMEKYQGLQGHPEQMWKVKPKVPVVTGASDPVSSS